MQTKGRGRLQRRWVSDSGNLSATLLYPTSAAPEQGALYGLAAAVAVAETLEAYRPQRPITLKWPNDVLVGGAKISGLLIERETDALLLGVGLNLVGHPRDTPYPATHLVAEMRVDDLAQDEPLFTGSAAVLALLSANVLARFAQLEKDGFGPVRDAWLARAHGLDGTVMVDGRTGRFVSIADNGALILGHTDGTESRVHAGDVSFG